MHPDLEPAPLKKRLWMTSLDYSPAFAAFGY
jgi:hypothetical protein